MLDGAYLRDLLVASDPELARLRQAGRATLTALLSTGVLHVLAQAAGQPTAIGLVGINAAMMGTVIVHDRTPRDQRITSMLVPVAASAALALGTLAAPIAWLRDGLFLIIAFVAALAGGRGPRGVALGMIAFLAYFSALFFHASVAQLPLMVAGIFVASAIAYVVRYRVLRERPAALVRQRHQALRRRLAIVLHHLARATETGHVTPRRVRIVRRALGAVNESALAIEEQLAARDERDPASEALRSRVFALELATAELCAATRALIACPSVPVADRRAVARELSAARAPVRNGAMNRATRARGFAPFVSRPAHANATIDGPRESPNHTIDNSPPHSPGASSEPLDPDAARAVAAVRDALADVLTAADPARIPAG